MVRMLALVGVVAASVGCQQDCTPRGSRVVHRRPTTHYTAPAGHSHVEPGIPPVDAVEPTEPGDAAEPMPAYPEPRTLERPPLPTAPDDVPAPPPAKDAASENPFE